MAGMDGRRSQAGTDEPGAPPSERTYMLAASEAEHARLIELARRNADTVREMCARAGVAAGGRVADIGCGPVGALCELAEVVGPHGRVVGLDSSAAAVETARAIVADRHLSNVAVVHGDINTVDHAALTAAEAQEYRNAVGYLFAQVIAVVPDRE